MKKDKDDLEFIELAQHLTDELRAAICVAAAERFLKDETKEKFLKNTAERFKVTEQEQARVTALSKSISFSEPQYNPMAMHFTMAWAAVVIPRSMFNEKTNKQPYYTATIMN